MKASDVVARVQREALTFPSVLAGMMAGLELTVICYAWEIEYVRFVY